MKNELISFETAKLAKEKGFNIECICYYNDFYKDEIQDDIIKDNYNSKEYDEEVDKWLSGEYSEKDLFTGINNEYKLDINLCKSRSYSAPTQSLLQKWLREVHNIDVWAVPFINDKTYTFVIFKSKLDIMESQGVLEFNTYEEALEVGLQEALKLIK